MRIETYGPVDYETTERRIPEQFSWAARGWVESLQARNLAPNSIKTYAWHIIGFLKFLAMKQVNFLTVTTPLMEKWILNLRAEEKSASTINTSLAAAKSLFRWLKRNGH